MAAKVLSMEDGQAIVRELESVDVSFCIDERQTFEAFAARLEAHVIEPRATQSEHMTELQGAHSPTPRTKEATSGPFLGFDLEYETVKLYAEDTWQANRQSKMLIKFPDYRIVLMAIRNGARMTEHKAAGCVSVQTISGRIRMQVAGNEFDMPAGRLLGLNRSVPHGCA